jgi:hypothetical protein
LRKVEGVSRITGFLAGFQDFEQDLQDFEQDLQDFEQDHRII